MQDIEHNPSGREIWTGVRVRTEDGKARYLSGMLVEPEASIIILTAMDRGDLIELWLTGKEQRAYPYGIRCGRDEWYYAGMSSEFHGKGINVLIFGILTVPLLGLGVLLILMSFGYFAAAATFAARHSREVFDRGYEAGVLGRGPVPAEATLQAA